MGRGVAYAAREFPFLLNVPAAKLSADSQDPLQFLRFARSRLPAADGEDFLPRSLYGDYLQEVLTKAEAAAPRHVRLTRVFGEVRDIIKVAEARPLAVRFADGSQIDADLVILATGNPPAPLLPWADAIRNHEAFRQNPWDLPKNLGARHSVVIVGNGLTMVDVALALSRDLADAPGMRTISRRGLLPHSQATFRAGAVQWNSEAMLSCAHSPRRLLAASRAIAREVENLGGDWREAVAFIRILAPHLWKRLPEVERRRFVRHLQPHWDIHRHRLPPQLAMRIKDLRDRGKLSVSAGRIQGVVARGRQLEVSWRPRGSVETATLTADLLVNATGPDYVISRSADPLFTALRRAGLVCADALDLGIRTAEYGACVDGKGCPSNHLFYLGPMLRAEHWEATAAAELRDHAEQLAAHLASPHSYQI
jgi:uncharacterized NAD(P)/FAD-binding protein YdhS